MPINFASMPLDKRLQTAIQSSYPVSGDAAPSLCHRLTETTWAPEDHPARSHEEL